MKTFLIALFALISFTAQAQNGIIRGTVYDEKTGETLVGVSIVIQGTTKGTMTDLDGRFVLEVAPAVYNLQVSYISFQTLTLENLEVNPGQELVFDEIMLEQSSLELQEVTVTANVIRKTEAALMTMKQNAPVMMDGISAARMQLTGDATAVEAAKRVTGVSIEDGKYVYVRGLGDRYSKTMLNQMDIPGLDPDRNSLQMDLFPANLIDNMMVSKNFSAEMPADFTGGMLNIETKDFPEQKTVNASFSLSYNPAMHFNPEYLDYEGGQLDFLGFDDGTRALPQGARHSRVPTPVSGASTDEVSRFVSSFNPNLGARRTTSFMDYSAGISLGNQFNSANKGKDNGWGYILALSYKSEQKYYDDVMYGEYQRQLDPESYEMRYATLQNGQLGERNVLIGAIGGLAHRSRTSKTRLTVMHLQNGNSKAGKFNIINDGQAVGQSGYQALSDNLEYNQRALTNILLHGNHTFSDQAWEIDWRLSPTYSTSEDPDIRKTAFTVRTNDTLFNAGAGGNPARIWRALQELNVSARADASRKYTFNNEEARISFGVSHTSRYRDYEILFFDIQFFSGQSWRNADPATVLNPENLFPNKPNSIYYQSGNNDPNPNEYQSNSNNTGIYVSNEISLLPQLKVLAGVRLENFILRHTGRDQSYANGDLQNGKNLDNDKVLESLDVFPSVNLIYALNKKQNLRASYSGTIARPTFKELSFAQIIDPMTNRIFNGSLFEYAGWQGNLTETRINNLDLRWELFPQPGEIFSVSAFYKHFDSPIELVRIPEQQTSTEYQPRNVGDGTLYGLELEMRKNLGFIAPALNAIGLSGNITLVESTIDMTTMEYDSRKSYQKAGETISPTRQMAGQAPYVINAGVTYNHIDAGIEAGLFYNVKGPTLAITGAGLFPDIYTSPFHSLNLSLSKKLGQSQNTVIDFRISNMLNERNEIYYQAFRAEKQPYEVFSQGVAFSLGISYKF
ncbi:MAG: TonB-dependent receptor [Bacteroidales bacterium]